MSIISQQNREKWKRNKNREQIKLYMEDNYTDKNVGIIKFERDMNKQSD